jgi:hypothetical protein
MHLIYLTCPEHNIYDTDEHLLLFYLANAMCEFTIPSITIKHKYMFPFDRLFSYKEKKQHSPIEVGMWTLM